MIVLKINLFEFSSLRLQICTFVLHYINSLEVKKFRQIDDDFGALKLFRKITVWKLRSFSLTHFWQKFRESNGFNK